jgi:hypothetical protein
MGKSKGNKWNKSLGQKGEMGKGKEHFMLKLDST